MVVGEVYEAAARASFVVPPSDAMTLAVICAIQMVARLPFGAGSGQWKNSKNYRLCDHEIYMRKRY